MKAFLEKLEIKASYQEVRVLFARIDFNLTGSLTFSEFMDRITNWKKFGKEWEKKAMQAKAQAKVLADARSWTLEKGFRK